MVEVGGITWIKNTVSDLLYTDWEDSSSEGVLIS